MAIVAETLVPRASRAEADRFDDGVEESMMQSGGPPPGLMAHFTRPDGDGFLICNVWRDEAGMEAFYADVVRPGLAAVGIEAEESRVSPVWAFARP